MIGSILDDPLRLLLVVGVITCCTSLIAMITGRARRAEPAPPSRASALELVTPSSVLARAEASARARRSAAGLAHPFAHILALPPAGQSAEVVDDPRQDRVALPAPAAEIVIHVAENDPQRMAEVITQWIRDDQTSQGFDRR